MDRTMAVWSIAALSGTGIGFFLAGDAGAIFGFSSGSVIGLAWRYWELVRL